MSVEKETLSGLKWASFAKLGGQIISWAVTLIVLRLLVPADYGLMAIVSMIIAVLASVAELGFGASLVQAPDLDRNDLGSVSGAVLALNLGMGVLVVLMAPLAAWFYAEPRLTLLIQVAALHFVFNAAGTIPQALAYRDMNFKWLAYVELATVGLGGLATLGLALLGYGVWALLAGSLLQNLVRTAMLLRHGMPWPVFQRRGLRRHLTFGGTLAITRLVSQIVYQSDVIIAGRLLSQQALGLYSVSLHLATLPMQKIMGVINQVAFPAFAKLQHDPARLRLRVLDASRFLMVLSLPILWGLSSVAPEFVAIVMGPAWAGAVFPLQLVCLVIPMRMLNIVYNTVSAGIGNMQVNVVNTVASAIVMPLTFFVGAHWGVNGLACAWAVAIPFVFFYCLPRLLKLVDTRLTDLLACVWVPVAAGSIMLAAVYLGRTALQGAGAPIRLVLLVALGAVAYIGAMVLLDRQIIPDTRKLLRAMRS